MNIWQLGSMHYFRPSSYIERNIAKKYLWQVSSYPSYSDLGDNDRWEKFINAIDKNTVDINSMKQNKTSLIVDDLTDLLGRHNRQVIDDILKNRGVKKWFLVRRLIIKLKDRWKTKINTLELMKKQAKKYGSYKEYLMLKGYQKCLIDCRQQIRALCNIPRELEDLTLPYGFEWRRPNKNYFRKREVK
jgi:hypothetical protein